WTSDPAALLRFLDGFQASVHVGGPGLVRADIHSDPPSDERLANAILRTGLGGAPRDYLATAVGEATTSVRVVAYGIAVLLGLLARAPPRNPSTPTRRVHPGERRRRATAIPGGDPARLRTDGAIVAALLCLALGARLVPLTFSPLPFSIDGFALARISSNIAADGTWRIDPADTNSYNQKLPGFSILWSAAAQVGGLSPLVHVQL